MFTMRRDVVFSIQLQRIFSGIVMDDQEKSVMLIIIVMKSR